MYKQIFSFLLTLTCSVSAFAGTEVLPNKSDVKIDGHNTEWNAQLSNYSKVTGINYEVANNDKNLYFILRITDEATQKQVMQNGLEVWINLDGKKRKVTGVTFPIGMSKDTLKNKRLAPNLELILTGFLLENGKQPVQGCPVQVAIAQDENNGLTYELCVPFNTFYKEQLDQTDAKLKCCFGFVVKSPESIQDNEGMPFGLMGGPMGGPMGMPPGMGMGMEPGMGSGSTNSSAAAKEQWFKTLLNVK